jgi:predicted CXXCH cytochrome family protein
MTPTFSNTTAKWLAWLILSMIGAGWLSYTMLSADSDKTLFMPGPLSAGHHQLADACDACHGDAFGGGEVLQQACVDCHGKERVKPFDSHPAKKFKDPRNVELLANINALQCVSCHTEHRPEITAKNGLTQPLDVCFYCHQEVAKDRPSHEGMGFDTCKDSGCHNFHNNRALYTDYLIKHLHEPPTLKDAVLPAKEFASLLDEVVDYPRDKYPVVVLTEKDIDAAEHLTADAGLISDWLETAHAGAGVNCTACHVHKPVDESTTATTTEVTAGWSDHPDHTACASCHAVEVDRFMQGKHGMRLKQGLSPMTPAQARLPMKQKASHKQLTCNSCHGGHRFDVKTAAVEACLGCHDDEHSLAYEQSPHYTLWQKELSGEAEAGSGVSCASCHMPRINYDVSEWTSRIIVDHNQSANLSPNSKMARSSCQHCHGLGFTLDALADEALINNNFSAAPTAHVRSMELAEKEKIRREEAAAKEEATEEEGVVE